MILSFYGELGNNKGRFYDLQLAKSVTLSGRFYSKLAQKMLRRLNYECYYGDTDSIFVGIKLEEIQNTLKYIHKRFDRVASRMNAFEGKIRLGFDNYYKKILFVTKKRYVGNMNMFKKEVVKDKIYARGVEIRRGDYPDISKEVQTRIIEMLLIEDTSMKSILRYLLKIRRRLLKGKMKKDKLVIYQSCSKEPREYIREVIDKKTGKPKIKKNGEMQYTSQPVQVKVAAKMIRDKKEFYVGMQIPYIVITDKPKLEAVHEDDFDGSYDAKYYWNKKIFAPVERLLNVAYSEFKWGRLKK